MHAESDPKVYEYVRRKPEQTILYKVVQGTSASFFRSRSTDGFEYPKFIRETFEKYLKCGLLEYGFVRCYCRTCQSNFLIAHSCKARGFCPSCYGRRQQEEAIFLDRIIPNYQVRQWVLSLPYELRFIVANNSKLTSRILQIFIRSVQSWYKLKARRMGYKETVTGAITFIQRATSALALSPHFHTLLLDGVYYKKDGEYFLLSVGTPTQDELQGIVDRVFKKSKKAFSEFEFNQAPLDLRESARNGVGHIKILENYMAIPNGEFVESDVDKFSAKNSGFSLNAKVVIKRDKRDKLAKLIRYVSRGPVALSRLKEVPGGVSYELKKAWHNGATHVVFSYESFIQKLIAMIPPRKAHQTRFHGIFAPNFKDRSKIIKPKAGDPEIQQPEPRRILWADLIKSSFNIDVMVCKKCSGRLEPIANIKDKKVAKLILDSLRIITIVPVIKSGIDPPTDDQLETFEVDSDQRPSDW